MEVAQIVQGPWLHHPEAELPDPARGKQELHEKKRMFEEAEDALQDARVLAFRDEDFFHNFDNDQWSDEEKAALNERGQPLYTHNRCKKKIKVLKGMEQRSRTDPKALARKPQGEAMAEVATDVLHAIDDKTKFDNIASNSFTELVVPGAEIVEVVWDDEDQQTATDRIRYDEFFYDPRSKELDFSDARYLGYAKWMDLSEAQQTYPDFAENLMPSTGSTTSMDFDDKPNNLWSSRHSGRQRVRVIVLYYKIQGKEWRLSHFTGNVELLDELSPWLDDKGKSICGIVAQACNKDRENRIYGELRDMIGPQTELNHYRAKMWHYANNRRTWGKQGAFQDTDVAKSEMAKVDGHVEVNPAHKIGEDWGFIESSEDVQLFGILLNQAMMEIGVQSPNEALVGRQAASQSGRAGEVQRDAGMTEEHDVFDLHRNFKERVYQRMFWMASQYWTEPDYIRVTDGQTDGGEKNEIRFLSINEPVFNEFGQQIGVRNEMAKMDVDIIVRSMPEVATLQGEQFGQLMQGLQAITSAPPEWQELVLEASSLKDKEKLLKILRERQQGAQQPPQPNPIQQAAMQLEMQKKQAEIKEREAKAAKTGEEAKSQALRNHLGVL